MQLAYRDWGDEGKPPLVILHGLLGSCRNWVAVARELAPHFRIFALDLRNHGASAHDSQMSMEAMSTDLGEFLDHQGLKKVHLLGHSLGGKVVMHFAAQEANRVEGLVVVDIAPKDYKVRFRSEFDALAALDLSTLTSREEADETLAREISNWAYRQFLLTNLVRGSDGIYQWVANISVLKNYLPNLRKSPLGSSDHYPGPTLFVIGADSDFVLPEDHTLIRHHFPRAIIKEIAGAGHNVHIENRRAFLQVINPFLQSP